MKEPLASTLVCLIDAILECPENYASIIDDAMANGYGAIEKDFHDLNYIYAFNHLKNALNNSFKLMVKSRSRGPSMYLCFLAAANELLTKKDFKQKRIAREAGRFLCASLNDWDIKCRFDVSNKANVK